MASSLLWKYSTGAGTPFCTAAASLARGRNCSTGAERHPWEPLHHEQPGEVPPLLPQGKMCAARWFTCSAGRCLAHLGCVSGLDSSGCIGQLLFSHPGSAGQLSHADKQLYDNADYVNVPVFLSFLVLPMGASIFWCVSWLQHSTCCLF